LVHSAVNETARQLLFESESMLDSCSNKRKGATMAQVQCVRCGNTGDQITEPLYLGKLEAQVKGSICAACWGEWVKMRVMVINEYQVNLGDESGRALVREQMLSFLKLPKPEEQQK
jgi:Fe-S cluster biosynthesis and repair protein YggX